MAQPTVFLVDAFRDECEMYAEYLAASGFSVLVCDGPEKALEDARRTVPDAIVTRLRQPKERIDGIALTAALKTESATRDAAVIVITSSIVPEHRVAAFNAGCDAYLVLPVTPDELVAEIRAILKKRSLAPIDRRSVRSPEQTG